MRVEWRDATGTLVGEPWTADYDVLGRRVRFGRGKYQTELWWDGLRIAAEEELVVERGPDGSASTRRARLRIYGYPSLDALVPSGFVDYANRDAAPASGAVYQVFTDPTGLPLAIEDARGETVWWATGTHPYGDVEVHPSSRIDYAMRWPGHRLDATLGLFYNRFRDYDPTLARYLQTDPIGQRGGINVYAYCNNPLKDVDLLGLAGTHGQHTPNPAPDGDAASTTGHPHTEGPPDPRARALQEGAAEGLPEGGITIGRRAEEVARDGGSVPAYAQRDPGSYYYDTESGSYCRREDADGRRPPPVVPFDEWEPPPADHPHAPLVEDSRAAARRAFDADSERGCIAADGPDSPLTESGFRREAQEGVERVPPGDVRDRADAAGHELRNGGANDQPTLPGGAPDPDHFEGRAAASHAEKQQATRGHDAIGVDRDMCSCCRGFMGAVATHEGRDIAVTDGSMTRVFGRDGSVTEFHPNGDVVQTTPPRSETE